MKPPPIRGPRTIPGWCWVLPLLVAAGSLAPLSGTAAPSVAVHVIDVGDGSAVHLAVAGRHFLLDIGPPGAAGAVTGHLAAEKVERLEAVVITHDHPDHAGALAAVGRRFPIGHLVWNGAGPGEDRRRWEQAAPGARITTVNGGGPSRMTLGEEVGLRFLPPGAAADLNGTSLVVLLEAGTDRLLFLADTPPARHREIVALHAAELEGVAWVLLPHHGDEVAGGLWPVLGERPWCAVSVGPNDRGLPRPGAMAEAAGRCREVARTDREGTLRFFAGQGIGREDAR